MREFVFIVTDEWVLRGDESYDELIRIFKHYDDAKKYFDERVATAKIDAADWGLDEISATEDHFEAYMDGEYSVNHIKITLDRKELY
jgi:hypothetical protein